MAYEIEGFEHAGGADAPGTRVQIAIQAVESFYNVIPPPGRADYWILYTNYAKRCLHDSAAHGQVWSTGRVGTPTAAAAVSAVWAGSALRGEALYSWRVQQWPALPFRRPLFDFIRD